MSSGIRPISQRHREADTAVTVTVGLIKAVLNIGSATIGKINKAGRTFKREKSTFFWSYQQTKRHNFNFSENSYIPLISHYLKNYFKTFLLYSIVCSF